MEHTHNDIRHEIDIIQIGLRKIKKNCSFKLGITLDLLVDYFFRSIVGIPPCDLMPTDSNCNTNFNFIDDINFHKTLKKCVLMTTEHAT